MLLARPRIVRALRGSIPCLQLGEIPCHPRHHFVVVGPGALRSPFLWQRRSDIAGVVRPLAPRRRSIRNVEPASGARPLPFLDVRAVWAVALLSREWDPIRPGELHQLVQRWLSPMVLVAPVEDIDDRHRPDAGVLTTKAIPRSQTGMSEGFVPAADVDLDLFGGRNRDPPVNGSLLADGSNHRLARGSILARSQGRETLPARDEPQGKDAVFLGQPVGFRIAESMAKRDALAMASHEREFANLFPWQPKVLADAACRRRVSETLIPLARHVPAAGTESLRVMGGR